MHGRSYEGSQSIDGHGLDESLTQSIGDRWHLHGVWVLKLAKLAQVLIGSLQFAPSESLPQSNSGGAASTPHQDFVRQKTGRRFQPTRS